MHIPAAQLAPELALTLWMNAQCVVLLDCNLKPAYTRPRAPCWHPLGFKMAFPHARQNLPA